MFHMKYNSLLMRILHSILSFRSVTELLTNNENIDLQSLMKIARRQLT